MNRIAYLIPTLDRIGGAEQQVLLLATGLAKRGWRTSVVTLSGNGGDAATMLQSADVAFHSLQMRKGLADPRGWLGLHRWITDHHPHILHAHLPHASLLARWSRIASPVRIVVDTIHSPATGSPARQIGFRLSTGSADVVTAVSRAAAQPWLNAGLVESGDMLIVSNGVDTDHWRRDDAARAVKRRELGFSHEFLWLSVGRLEPVKNHATLLRAFAAVPNHARLVIAGEGPLKADLHALALQLGIRDRVSFPGFQRDVREWMRAADAFVLCSSWEGLPMTLLEAGACEVPAVISDVPGSREALADSNHGAVPVGDAQSLATAMISITCLSEQKRRELGRRARLSIATKFDLDAVLTNWEDLYGALLEQNPQPSRFGTGVPVFGRIFQLQ